MTTYHWAIKYYTHESDFHRRTTYFRTNSPEWQSHFLESNPLCSLTDVIDVTLEKTSEAPYDWQAEALEWRRGVGAFIDYMYSRLILSSPPAPGERTAIYEKLLELCPRANIDYDPDITDADIGRAKKLAEGLDL